MRSSRSSIEQRGLTASATVKVLSGHNLLAADGVFKKTSSDPYVKLKAGKAKARTKYVLKSLNPVWNETLVLR